MEKIYYETLLYGASNSLEGNMAYQPKYHIPHPVINGYPLCGLPRSEEFLVMVTNDQSKTWQDGETEEVLPLSRVCQSCRQSWFTRIWLWQQNSASF
jgi:hypothetical protein